MKKTHYAEESENHEEKQDSRKKNRLILGVTIVTAITAICIMTGCLNSVLPPAKISIDANDSNVTKKLVPKIDNSEFVKIWNNEISKIKFANTYLTIDFNKYKLEEAPQKDLISYISFDKSKNISLKEKLENSKFKFKYMPIISWIEMKLKVNYTKPEKEMDSSELMKYTAGIISPNKPFSNNTIDTVVQLNEFCYYFDKNKDRLYREGYTRNIKSCEKIQEILDVGEIVYRVN